MTAVIVSVSAVLLGAVPLVLLAACALRRAGRKVDQILVEESDGSRPEAASPFR